MKFLALADIHLKNWNDKVITEDGIPLKLKECLDVIDNGCKLCFEKNVENVIIAGDLNDTKGILNVVSFTLFKELMEKHHKLNFHIIPGNHDATMRESNKYAVDIVRGPSNVFVYTEPTVVDDITFMPWSNDDLFDNIAESSPNNVLISHFGLNEAHLSSGISLRSRFKTSQLRHFGLCILGHYHCPQNVENVYYVGSPIPYRRDEVNDKKRYLFVDSETLEVESIETTGYRRFIQIVINEEADISEIKKELESLKNTDDFVVIKNELKLVPEELKTEIDENNNVQVVDRYIEEHNIRGITMGMTLPDQMKKYLEINGIDNEDVLNEFVGVGMKYLNRGESA